MSKDWTWDSIWPPSSIDIGFYIMVLAVYIICIYECLFLKKFSKLSHLQYFKIRQPNQLIGTIVFISFYILIVSPISSVIYINITQNDWKYPIIVRIITNVFFIAVILAILTLLWILLFDFKFQRCVFYGKMKNMMQYIDADLNGMVQETLGNINNELDLNLDMIPKNHIIEESNMNRFWISKRWILVIH